jgi:hypothetical protein
MEAITLIEGYQRILRTIYSPTEYYRRALDCLSLMRRDEAEPRRSGILKDVMAFIRVTFKLGVCDPARLEFWRYMRRALTSHRPNFSNAITLAAMGYHFRKVTEICAE